MTTFDSQAVRREFPIVDELVYLNSAATGPISTRCQQAMARQIDERARLGNRELGSWQRQGEKVRCKLADLINVDAAHIGFVKNTSDAISTVASGLRWNAGDNVVLAEGDFPSNYFPWLRAREAGVELRFIRDRGGRTCVDDARELIDEHTRIVSLSFVRFDTGYRVDLAALGELCRSTQTLFMVDVIQGLGALRVNAPRCGINLLACGCHKWMLGPMGIGFLYADETALSQLEIGLLGWKNVADAFDLGDEVQLVAGARRFESGTENWSGLIGLGGALEVYAEVGYDAAETHVLALNEYLREGLHRISYEVLSPDGDAERSGVLICASATHSADVVANRLLDAGIVVVPRGKGVRISPHYFNTRAEIDQLLEALP